MSKASDTILKDLLPLYEKWLNQDGISIQQVGLICLGSAIACLQQAGYSPNEIVQSAIMSVIPRGAKVEYRDTDGNSDIGYQDADRPLNPQEVKDVAVSCIRCDKEFMPALFCPSCSGESSDRALNPQEVKIVTDYANRNCKHEWSLDEHGDRRCIGCGTIGS